MKTEKFDITGMTCAACQANITRNVQKLNGVQEVQVSLLSNEMTVTYDENALDTQGVVAAVTGIGYGASPKGKRAEGEKSGFRGEWQMRQKHATDEQDAMRRRLWTSLALLIPLMYIAMGQMLGLPMPAVLRGEENIVINAFTQLLIAIPILFINRRFYEAGGKALLKRSPNMDSLVATGSAAALIYGIFALYRMMYGLGHQDMALVHRYSHELYFESSAMILALVTVGKYLEARSKAKTSDALGKLVDLSPKTATVIRDGKEQSIPSEEVREGDVLLIRPGERIPVDGVVIQGCGYVDQSAITGESIPVEKKEEDAVISATVNKNGSFKMRATRVGEDTTLAQIIRLVDEAGNSKAPIARLADRVSAYFVPTVIGIAFFTLLVWLFVGEGFEFALSCGITVLVISCPCALGLATPVAIMVGTGKAAEYGILIKSAQSLENLHSIDTLLLDKTGTITEGRPSLTDIAVLDETLSEKEFLAEAAAVEAGSEHPLATAVLERAKAEGLHIAETKDFMAAAGRGVSARVNGKAYLAGNAAYLLENGLKQNARDFERAQELGARYAQEGKTPLFFARDGRMAGVIAVADTIRESSREAIRCFKEQGLHVIMLTGDNQATAEAIRKELGLEKAVAELLPTDKEACIRRLQEEGHKVAMVGDGINDAPALMRADLGIAIGAGTDIAIDAADIVLMKDSLLDVATAIDLSRSVIRNIRMNLFWAFFYNVLGIPIAAGAFYPAFGLRLSPMIGAAAMSLSSVCVVTNALRLRWFKGRTAARSEKTHDETAIQEIHITTKQEEGTTMKKCMKVEGMMCAHCQAHVKKALEGVIGVSGAEVDLEAKTATVTLNEEVADEILKAAVTEAGYEVTGCETL